MSTLVDQLDGVAAVPRSNGELAFTEPWESQVFGITLGLSENGSLDFAAFQQRLIARIQAWEASDRSVPWSYWTHWAGALEDEIVARELLTAEAMDAATDELLAEYTHDHPHDEHDHEHDHDHDHEHGTSSP